MYARSSSFEDRRHTLETSKPTSKNYSALIGVTGFKDDLKLKNNPEYSLIDQLKQKIDGVIVNQTPKSEINSGMPVSKLFTSRISIARGINLNKKKAAVKVTYCG